MVQNLERRMVNDALIIDTPEFKAHLNKRILLRGGSFATKAPSMALASQVCKELVVVEVIIRGGEGEWVAYHMNSFGYAGIRGINLSLGEVLEASRDSSGVKKQQMISLLISRAVWKAAQFQFDISPKGVDCTLSIGRLLIFNEPCEPTENTWKIFSVRQPAPPFKRPDTKFPFGNP